MPLPSVYRFDGITLDSAAMRLTRGQQELALEPKSFRLLQFLIENRDRVLSKEEIFRVVWLDTAVTDNALTRAIAQIRKALDDDPKSPRYIDTIPTVGYRFIAPLTLDTLAPVPLSAPTLAQVPRKKPHILTLAAMAIIILIAAGVAAWKFRPQPPAPATSTPIRFTTYRGSQSAPSFSPDGNQIAFHWDGEKGDNFDIYVKSLSVDATPLRLTTNPAPDRWPAWSPDGSTIAFVRSIAPDKVDLMFIPALGGPERKLAEFPARLGAIGLRSAWTADGKWLVAPAKTGDATALFRVSVETGESSQITAPDSGFEDLFPTISPDGKALLFVRVPQMFNLGDLYQVPLDATAKPLEPPRRIAEGSKADGLSVPAWMPDGKEILARTFIGAVRMPAGGSTPPTQIPWTGPNPNWLEISRRGNRLAFAVQSGDANIYRIDLTQKDPRPEPLVNSTDRDVFPQYSPDGSRLAFYSYRTGFGQVYVSDSEGNLPRQLTFVKQGQAATPHWSPDGKRLAIDSNTTGLSQIYLISPDGGKMTQLTHAPYANFAAVWSRDGKWMYFTSKKSGRDEIWKMPDGGGPAVQVTHNGGVGAMESLDGKTLYFGKDSGAGSIWRMPVAGGPEEQVADSLFRTNFAATGRGIYYMTSPDFSRKSTIRFYNFATGATTTILPIGIGEFGLDISPDGRYLAYDQLDNPGSVLMLLENFH